MLGTLTDAQDATQKILLRVISHLSTFEGKSSFKTWVYRISCNYLINYKKSMFAQHPLSFDAQTRCIFILGTMFHIDSKIAADILHMTPENYRQKLSKAKHNMANFLSNHCDLTETSLCNCRKRSPYAILQHRINPAKLDFKNLQPLDHSCLLDIKDAMEVIDDTSSVFEDFSNYKADIKITSYVKKLLQSNAFKKFVIFNYNDHSHNIIK